MEIRPYKMENIKVSIVIPIYNVEQYIERCLFSVMAQTYTDIECVLVDDCTSDNSIVKCQECINSYFGPIEFKILHHDLNLGLSAARNTGTNAANGDYIFYLDSDDEITPDCIALMMAEAERHPNVEMVSAAIESIPYSKYYDNSFYSDYHFVEGNRAIRSLFFNCNGLIYVMAWNKLIKRSFLKDNGLEFVEGIKCEDEVWSFALMLRCNALAIIPQKTYVHYDTAGSIMNSFNYNSRCETLSIVLDKNVKQIESPLARLQIYRCMQHLFSLYRGVRRKRYASPSKRLALLLAFKGRPILGLQTFIYFRFNSLLSLKRYEKTFVTHFDRLYEIESAKACIVQKY